MRKFYFDTALTASPNALPSLLAFADPHRITYGSDFPYADPPPLRTSPATCSPTHSTTQPAARSTPITR